MRLVSCLFLIALAAPAWAQQQTDPQRLLVVLEQQRNTALNAVAHAEAQRAQLAEENQRLKAENEELRKKAEGK